MIKLLSPYRLTELKYDAIKRLARFNTSGIYHSLIYQKNNKYIISSSDINYFIDPWLEENHISSLQLAITILDRKLIQAGFTLTNTEDDFNKYKLLI